MKKHILFICTANIDRSPTAEDLLKDSDSYEAKSAGTHPLARKKIEQKLIDWADIIFVMNEKEDQHLTYLKNNFDLSKKNVYDLDIQDIYKRGDKVLIDLLKKKIGKLISL